MSGSESEGALPQQAQDIAAGYAVSGAALELGALLWDGAALPGAQIRIPLGMLNRHGLVAGATGTGKTKTLQLLAEQLSAHGVPVFLADIKGDVSGISAPGQPGEKVSERAGQVGQEWTAAGFPSEFYALGGIGSGIPLRATVTSFGPVLLSKVLQLNRTQEQSLGLIFHYADSKGLELIDLKDLRAVVAFLVSDTGKAELKGIGGLSTATAGVILRSVTAFEQQGAGDFFGEPEFDTAEFLRQAPDGRGLVSVLELAAVQDKPQLFSTFLMWLLSDLFHDLPEVGDLDRPKLVFFLDEAHLLFSDASKAFLDAITAGQEEYGLADRDAADRAAVEEAVASGAPEERKGAPEERKEEGSLVRQVVGSRMFKSLARSVGTQVGREISPSLFGTSRRRR